jgi:AcrR family transcriptional regulator
MSTDDPRTRLLETAGEIFAEKGFRAATVREICSAAGANIASVNYYFGDKLALYIEAVKHAHSCRFNDPPPTWSLETPPEQKLVDFVRGMLTHLLDKSFPPWNVKLILREMVEPSEACRELTEQKIRPMATILFGILTELVPPGTPQVKTQMTAFSVIGQCLFYRVQEPVARQLVGPETFDAFTVEQLTDHIVGFTLAALGRKLPARSAQESPS